jgi:menaquinone-9 beta-reductase
MIGRYMAAVAGKCLRVNRENTAWAQPSVRRSRDGATVSTARCWDVVIVGSGPAGCAAALAARHADPSSTVLLVDKSVFPRDKPCGDAVLNLALNELSAVGVSADALLHGYRSTSQMRLTTARGVTVFGRLPEEMTVIPRRVFDARLLAAALAAGVTWRRLVVREVCDRGDHVQLNGRLRAHTVIGADGAESVVRRAVHDPVRRDVAVALRGYDAAPGDDYPTMVFEHRHGLAYAWRFPGSNPVANVGYGHLLRPGERASRGALLATMSRLLPGTRPDPASLRAHRLPLSSTRQRVARGRILLAGDAAALVNPLSGEGIYYAIASGIAAGALAVDGSAGTAARYRSQLNRRFGAHRLHVTLLSTLTASDSVLEAGLVAAGRDGSLFEDLAGIGLADGRISFRLLRGLGCQLLRAMT